MGGWGDKKWRQSLLLRGLQSGLGDRQALVKDLHKCKTTVTASPARERQWCWSTSRKPPRKVRRGFSLKFWRPSSGRKNNRSPAGEGAGRMCSSSAGAHGNRPEGQHSRLSGCFFLSFFFLIEGSLLYGILLFSVKHEHESARDIHMGCPLQ